MGESSGHVQTKSVAGGSQLSRVLNLWDLIFYGFILISPIAAGPLLGVAQELSQVHCVTTLLAALTAMALAAISYGRVATLCPSAGSADTYIGRGLNPHLGFLVGWAMFLDYLIQPILNSIHGALTIQLSLPTSSWVAAYPPKLDQAGH